MTCALDDQALARQLDRFAAIGRHALWARREPGELTAVLDHDLDDRLLREALEVEKNCCPFFAVIWEAETRQLTIAARDEHAEVLERIADAFGMQPAFA